MALTTPYYAYNLI